jgi:hypothetical protein
MTIGVFSDPPTVRFPTLMTGRGARCALRMFAFTKAYLTRLADRETREYVPRKMFIFLETIL